MKNDPPYFVHASSYVDDGCVIGSNVKVWHFCHLMEKCRIGDDCHIGQNVVIGRGVVLGRNVKVQNNVTVYEGVTCEDDVFLGPAMVFTNVINPRSAIVRKHALQPTLVQKGASIGANATIVCGNTIGAYALVGAGAVITRSVPAYALMTGNPARQSGWVSEYGHTLRFDALGLATCLESGQQYQLSAGAVRRIG